MVGGTSGTTGELSKGARIVGDQRSALATVFGERYAGGESIRSIAADTGRSYGFVHGVLKESGASLRGRGGATRGPRRGAADQVVASDNQAAASPVRTKVKAKDEPAKAAKGTAAKSVKEAKAKKKDEPKKSGKKSGKKG